MVEDCVYNSMLRASCVHFLGSQTSTSNVDHQWSGVIGKVRTDKKRSLGGISVCEIGLFGKEKKETKGITCNSCYFTVKIHKIPSITKKSYHKFLGVKSIFWRDKIYFSAPKLGAKSPPMHTTLKLLYFGPLDYKHRR